MHDACALARERPADESAIRRMATRMGIPVKPFFYWLLACCEDNYRSAYWEAVAQGEQWLKLLTELTDE